MEKILSIVVPVYNVEKYIKQCLNSFVVEDILEKLEVLVIDDATPDQSAEIARRYVEKYPNTFRVISKENGGHGSAINAGVREAAGKYFKVIDGDDWVDKKALYNLMMFLDDQTCDLVYSNYCWVKEDTGKSVLDMKEPFKGVEYGKVYSFDDVAGKSFLKMHNITIKTEILKQYCKPITEKCFYVDCEYILYPIPYVHSVAFLDDVLYMYRIGRAEQSVNIRKMRERCNQHERILNNLLEFYGEHKANISNETADYLAKGVMKMFVSQIKIYLSYKPEKKYKEKIVGLEQRVLKEFPEIYHMVKNKAVLLLRMSRYQLYVAGSVVFRLTHPS